MKSKSFLTILLLVLVVALTGCSFDAPSNAIANGGDVGESTQTQNSDQSSAVSAEQIITVGQMAAYLQNKSEHYPFSDEFMERYQQTSGGYIDNAKKAGLLVDKYQHEPNQKWHFFDSWLAETLLDTPDIMEEDAKSRVYTKLLCPELLLWIYEACEVDPIKVRNAMDVAMQGKAAGTSVSTIAKNMRDCVSWEDILLCFQNKIPVTSVVLNTQLLQLSVGGDDAQISATVAPADANEVAFWTIVQGDDCVSLTARGNVATLHALKEGSAKIQVRYNADVYAECIVTVIDDRVQEIINLPTSLTLREGKTSTLSPAFNKGEGTFVFASQDQTVATVSADGTVTAVAKGNTNIVVSCAENPQLTKTVALQVVENTASSSSTYTFVDDLGTGKRHKLFETTDALFAVLTLVGDSAGNIDSISKIENIYGGGYGGSGDTAWYFGKMLKLGTGSTNGVITFEFSGLVNYVKITGYVGGSSCTIRVGDSLSADWTDGEQDNKTTTHACKDMTVINKDTLDNGEPSTIVLNFADTDSVTLATINTSASSKKPLYIVTIEFGYDATLEQ